MKAAYIIWGVIVCFILISHNSSNSYLFSGFAGGGGGSGGGFYMGGYGRGWDSGSSGGYHK